MITITLPKEEYDKLIELTEKIKAGKYLLYSKSDYTRNHLMHHTSYTEYWEVFNEELKDKLETRLVTELRDELVMAENIRDQAREAATEDRDKFIKLQRELYKCKHSKKGLLW